MMRTPHMAMTIMLPKHMATTITLMMNTGTMHTGTSRMRARR